MTTVIIDYGSGNLRSAAKSFERVARETGTGVILVSGQAEDVARATRIVLPGVGAFADCWAGLNAAEGLVDALTEAVQARGVPFLGICVGMQLLAREGREHGVRTPGLGWIDGTVDLIRPADPALKIPHMGWNELQIGNPHPVLDGITTGDHAYFVHSYAMSVTDAADVAATVDYGGPVTAAVARANVFGTQFHPEKSQRTGLRLISNFLKWTP